MVAHLQPASHPEWSALHENSQEKPGQVFVLLVVRDRASNNTQLPPTQAHLMRGIDLEDAKQAAQKVLRRDAEIRHVTVMDDSGVTVLGVANRSEFGWHVPAYPAHRLAFH